MVSVSIPDLKLLQQQLSTQSEIDLLEPLSSLLQMSIDLKAAALSPDQQSQFFGVLPSIISTLLSKCRYSSEGLEKVTEIFCNLMLSMQLYLSNSKYLEALRLCVELEKPLYQNYAQDLRVGSWNPEIPEETLEKHSWREGLSIGDLVDAIKCDNQYDRKSWASGKIIEIDEIGILKIAFQEEGPESDRTFPRTSHEISQYKSKTSGESWREGLKPNSLIDCIDASNIWYNSTVLSIKTTENLSGTLTRQVLVGFRVYESHGEKFDEKGNYRGWSSKFDEWISIRSPRIAPFGLNARMWVIPHINFNEEKIIEDSNDMLEDTPNTFCVTRPKKCNSAILVKVLNRFGASGNYEFILKTLLDKENWAGFETIFTFAYVVGKVYSLYHKKFAMNYILKFKDALFSCLIHAPIANYREYSKEKLNIIFDLCENLLKRVLTINQKNSIVDEFHLSFSLKNFETPYLERRIYGLKGIIDAVGKTKSGKSRGFQPLELAKWLKKHEIIADIFGINGHYQLVQRTTELIKLLASENVLHPDDLAKIWATSQKNDEDMRKSVYKVLTDLNTTLKAESLEFLVKKIAELPSTRMQKEEIELMFQLTKYTVRAGNASTQACDFFNKVVLDINDYSETTKELCLEAYCNLLKSWEKAKNRPAVMAQCVENIRENRESLSAIKIIEKLLATFSVTYCSKDTPTRNSVTQDLINDQGALTALFDNLKHFKSVFSENDGNYSEEVQARLGFLKTLISECYMIRLSARQLDLLWELLYVEAYNDQAKEVFIKWFSETTENQLSGKRIFEEADITKFFHEKLNNFEKDYSNMSLSEFSVFKNCFLLVNINCNNMKRLYSNLSMSASEMISEFDYGVQVPPTSLLGMSCLRKILIESLSEKVSLQASDLLFEIYNHISEVGLKEVREELIEYFLTIIKNDALIRKKKSVEGLKRFIEESEKDGTGNLKSHSSLLKGDLCVITVTNNITYHPYSPEIPKKIEIVIHNNSTLWQLRCNIGKFVKCLHDQFKILRTFSNSEIKDRENGKTLSNLKFRATENLSVVRRTLTKPKVSLLNSDNKLTPRAEKIFRALFYKFADKDDKMSAEGCSAFTNSCTGDHCKPTDKKTLEFVSNNDSDYDGLLTVEDFIRFYTNSSLIKPTTVWNNLTSHHYRHDLRRYDDDDNEDFIENDALPTMILINNRSTFDLLFSILDEKTLANDAWELLTKLPTNPHILQQVSEAEVHTDWTQIFIRNHWHSLAYILQMIESFMEDPIEDDKEKSEKNRLWKLNFVHSRGLLELFNILQGLKGELDTFQKICLASVLKIICIFFSAAFSACNPEIYETLELVRKGSEEVAEFEEDEQKKLRKAIESPEKYSTSQTFAALVDDIKVGKLYDVLIQSTDFSELVVSLLVLMWNAMGQQEYSIEDNHILDSALELWISCILHKHELLEKVYTFYLNFEEFVTKSLTKPKTFAIRKNFSQAYLSICNNVICKTQAPVSYFLTTLLNYIQNSTSIVDNTQLYELATQLISLDKQFLSQDYRSLASYLSQRIFSHPFTEKKNSNNPDRTLIGLLKLLEKIFEHCPDYRKEIFPADILTTFFRTFLFPEEPSFEGLDYDLDYLENTSQLQPPKAKFRESRNSAYKLLKTLSAGSEENLDIIKNMLIETKSRVKLAKTWGYSPNSELRSMHGYAGITNLGAICYMSSMLQQFYMIPQFRYSILAADNKKPTNFAVLEKTGETINDNLLYQLQSLFAYLEITDRNSYNPSGFCYSFKDFNGNPTNTSIQQDSQEFLNMIFDKLDFELSTTPYKLLTKGVFGGQSCSQVICSECKEVNENIEDFYNLSVDVKHSKSLYESFQKLIAGDTISDYHCAKCDKKVDITRRTVISKLPNVLIVHLQRIVFNFDTYANEKINTRLEFPHDLNLLPYTKQGLDNIESTDCFNYELVGIVVHSGTADLGHYYSYIRENSQNNSKKWLEFNDSAIRSFK